MEETIKNYLILMPGYHKWLVSRGASIETEGEGDEVKHYIRSTDGQEIDSLMRRWYSEFCCMYSPLERQKIAMGIE